MMYGGGGQDSFDGGDGIDTVSSPGPVRGQRRSERAD